jgi:hypothetical protein
VTSVDPLFFFNEKNHLSHFVCAVYFALRACARSVKDCPCLSVYILAILQRSPVAAWFGLRCFCSGTNRSRVLVLISLWSIRSF